MGERILLPEEPDSVEIAKRAVKAIGGSGRKLWKKEELIVGDMPSDGPDLLAYLISRRQAEKGNNLAQFVVLHLENRANGRNPTGTAESQNSERQTE